jgi:hypothetical protein
MRRGVDGGLPLCRRNWFDRGAHAVDMVSRVERDGTTWFRCDRCGMLFQTREEAAAHEATCDAEDPTYLQ